MIPCSKFFVTEELLGSVILGLGVQLGVVCIEGLGEEVGVLSPSLNEFGSDIDYVALSSVVNSGRELG